MWTHVVIEGFCFAQHIGNKDDPYPCGQDCPSMFCLGDRPYGICPHFAWAKANEREAAFYAPLHHIIWDRIKFHIVDDYGWKIRWYLWDKWFWKAPNIEVREVRNLPAWDAQVKRADVEYEKWIKRARKKSNEK